MTFSEWYLVGLVTFPFFFYMVYNTSNAIEVKRGRNPDIITEVTYRDIIGFIIIWFIVSLLGYAMLIMSFLLLLYRISLFKFWDKEIKIKK